MQNFYKRAGVLTGFVILLIILIANAFITRRQLAVQVANQSWVLHSRQVLFELSQIESLLKDAETGQRGYLYTGQARYLQPYNQAITQIEPHIQKLAQLTSNDLHQQANIPQLRDLSREKLSELAKSIDLYRVGRSDEAKALVLSNFGLATMDKIRTLMNQMMQEETSVEQMRMAEYQRSIRATVISIYLASILAALGLLLLAFRILREMDLRERHDAEIREREEWFRVTLTSIGDAVIATDRQGIVTFVNPVAVAIDWNKLCAGEGQADSGNLPDLPRVHPPDQRKSCQEGS